MTAMTLEGLHTATIGSFPLDDSERNRARILDGLLDLKIDFPNYPQLIEMGKQFLDDIDRGASPPGVEPFDWAVKCLERKDLKGEVRLKACLTGPFTLASYVKTEKAGGPSYGMPLFNTALANREEVERFTEILAETCEAFGREASMVFIDEPIMSLIVGRRRILFGYKEEDIVYTYNRLKNACGDAYVGTHICGRISPMLANALLKTDLDILSHELFD
ncbi:MAG: uroporphyrinogen decarboxylase family protein, partial [Candidatus Bathyarchaeia archaeon]